MIESFLLEPIVKNCDAAIAGSRSVIAFTRHKLGLVDTG